MTFGEHNRLLDQVHAARSGELKVAFKSGWREQVQVRDKQGESFDYSMRFESNKESRRNSVPGKTDSHSHKRQEFTYTQSKTSYIDSFRPHYDRNDVGARHISNVGHRQVIERGSTSKTDEDSILQPLTPRTFNGFSKETDRSSLRKTSDLQIVRESQNSDLNADTRPSEALQSELIAAAQKISSLSVINSELQAELGKLRSELDKKQQMIAELERSINHHGRNAAQRETDLEQSTATEKQMINRLASDKEPLTSNIGASSQSRDSTALRERQEAVSKEIEEIGSSIDGKTNKMIELKSMLFKLEAEKSSKQRKMADLDRDISNLQIKVAEKEKVIQEVRAAHSIKTTNKQKLLSELKSSTEIIEDLTASIEQEVIIITKQRNSEDSQRLLDDSNINVSESFGRLLEASSRIKSSTKTILSAWRKLTGAPEDSEVAESEPVEEEEYSSNSIPGLLKNLNSILDQMGQVTKNLERTQTRVDAWNMTSDSISAVMDKQQRLSKANLDKIEKIHLSSQSIENSLSELRGVLVQDLEGKHGSVQKLSMVEKQLIGFEADLLAFVQNIRRDVSREIPRTALSIEVEQPMKMVGEILQWFHTSYSKSQSVVSVHKTLSQSQSELQDVEVLIKEAAAEEKKLADHIDSVTLEIDRLRAETHLKLSELSRLEGKIEYMKSHLEVSVCKKQQQYSQLMNLNREIEQYLAVTVEESNNWLQLTQVEPA